MNILEPAIRNMLAIEGAIGAAIVANDSGMALATGGTQYDMDMVSAMSISIIRAFEGARDEGGGDDSITLENIVGIYNSYLLLIRLLEGRNRGFSMIVVLDRDRANQAMANHKLGQISSQIAL